MSYSHNKGRYASSNTDDFIHHNTKNLMESKDHNKARSTGTQYEHMGDSIESYNPQRRLDPALSLPNSSSNVSHNSSPKRNAFHSSPKKTSKFKLYQKSEAFITNPYSCKKRAGVLSDKQSDVINRGSGICDSKRATCYINFGSFCSEGEKVGAVNEGMKVEGGGVECSMCGDVGIAELLFLCSKCSLRPQHTYCGRSYPNVGGEASICNWCLHEQDSSTSSVANESKLLHNTSACEANDRNIARSTVNVTHPVKELQCPATVCVDEGYTEKDASVERMGPHGKAFDYLLLVAAQSGNLPQVISEASDEMRQTNQTASMINITGSKIMTSSHKIANRDSDKKAKMGLTESNGSVASQARINNERERSMTGLVKKLNMEIVQSAVDMKVDQSRSDHGGGVYAGGNTPKRQRCSKGAEVAVLKCKRRGLQLSPARPNYRRYKLLADVVC